MFRISTAESFPRYRELAPHSLNSGIDDESSSWPRISHRRRTGAFSPVRISRFNSRRNDPGKEKEKLDGGAAEGRRGDRREGRAWPRSRLTRWTHYHSSIWGTFGRSDQWLSIPCNGVRSDIRHRGTLYQGRYNWSTLSPLLPPPPPGCPSFPYPTVRWKRSRATRGSVLARREKRIQRRGRTADWNRSFEGFGARGSVRERQACKDGGTREK